MVKGNTYKLYLSGMNGTKASKHLQKPLSGFQQLAKQKRFVCPNANFHSRNLLVKQTTEVCSKE